MTLPARRLSNGQRVRNRSSPWHSANAAMWENGALAPHATPLPAPPPCAATGPPVHSPPRSPKPPSAAHCGGRRGDNSFCSPCLLLARGIVWVKTILTLTRYKAILILTLSR